MIFKKIKKDYLKILIAGPHRVGKSSRLDVSEELYPEEFERGEKYKYRIGGPWPSDGQKKDSQSILNKEDGEKLIADGKIAFDYWGPDTWHLVSLKDAIRTDKYIMYLCDVNRGTRAFKQYFNGNIITFLFYTSPELIEIRLKDAQRYAQIPDEQIIKRLNTFEEEFAAFERNADLYLFPMLIKWPPINSNIFLPEGFKEKERREVEADVRRLVALISGYHKYAKPGMSVEEFHEEYSNNLSKLLVGSDLPTLRARLENWKATPATNEELKEGRAVRIDLSNELRQYQKPLPDEIKKLLQSIKVVAYEKFNGVHTIALEGLVNPYSQIRVGLGPEDGALDLLEARLGQPTQRRLVMNERFGADSYFGRVFVKDGLVRDGAHYSLGNPLPTTTTHPSVSIIFVYSNGKEVSIHGHSLDKILELQRKLGSSSYNGPLTSGVNTQYPF